MLTAKTRTFAGFRILCALLAAYCLGPQAQAQDYQGAIRGTVLDTDFGVPLSQVRVQVLEARATTLTSVDGTFLLERIPAGEYTVTFSKEGYERVVRPNVVVLPGSLADVDVRMAQSIVEMPELVVTGAELLGGSEMAMLEIRAQAVTVQDAVSSELLSKAGVSDVAGALKLVVGASVVEGKYATVRGLSDRYTGTTLNGIRVPSADPRKRAVQMDLFPSSQEPRKR